MVEKEYSDLFRVSPRVDKMTFTEHVRGLKAEYDKILLEKYLPVTSGVVNGDTALADRLGVVIPEGIRNALMETQFIGVFGRVLKSSDIPDLICLQYLYVWDCS